VLTVPPPSRAVRGALVAAVAAGCIVVALAMDSAWPLAGVVLVVLLGELWRRDVERLARRARAAEQHAAAMTVRDDLTGCVNRPGLVMFGEHVLQTARRQGDCAHLLLVEVAGLSAVRARSGDRAADEVLAAVADALHAGTRGTDVVARWRPDTFAVLGPGSGTGAAELERRVRVHLLDCPPLPPGDWPCTVTAGSGVLQPWDSGGLTDLLTRAEEDLLLRRALRAPSAPEPPLPRQP
jgi:diguanylate cyclase (GGDEF)-like protein